MDQYKQLEWHPTDNYIHSDGPVRVVLEDAITHAKTIITADDIDGSPTGDIIVKGKIKLERAEGLTQGTIIGRALTYRYMSRTGVVLDATAQLERALLTGEKIEIREDQSLRALQAYFTTCTAPRPHFHITAREITVNNKRTVTAKHVTFWLGRTRIVTLPSIRKSFSKGVENPIPLPGYSKENLIQFRLKNDLVEQPNRLFNYDVVIGLKRTPQAAFIYETDLGKPDEDASPPRTRKFSTAEPLRSALESSPPLLVGSLPEDQTKRASFYTIASTGSFVFNRQRTDLRVARFPEIGVSFRNILNRTQPTLGDQPKSAFGVGFISPANWFVNAELGLGYFQEQPTHTRSTRLGFRTDATSPLFRVAGPLYARYGGTLWSNVYDQDKTYTLIAPESELVYLLRANTLIGAAFKHQFDFGTSPFVFDRLDVANELRLRYGFVGANWAYDAVVKYDISHFRAYDNIFGIRRRLDCLEYGVQYRTRNQGFSLVLNLLPGPKKENVQGSTR